MRELKYPAIYKHFKNKFYATIGLSTYIDIDKLKNMLEEDGFDVLNILKLPKRYISFTENSEEILCINYRDKWYHVDICKEDLVLYKSLDDDKGAYGRPVEMFLSKVGREKYPKVSQQYRFEEFYK